MKDPIELLPAEILQRANLNGNEYAWRVEDIPCVIEAGRALNLVNIGGQLQFRLPDGTAEVYWIEVDPTRWAPADLPRDDYVNECARLALEHFDRFVTPLDLIEEGRKAFPGRIERWEARGHDPREFMWFVWYLAKPS